MDPQLENSFQIKFQNNVEMQLQQQGNPVEQATVVQDDASAEKIKIKDIFANTAAKESTERHARTKWSDPKSDGVWLAKPNPLYEAFLIDDADQLATSISLTGAATMISGGTLNRARIQRMLEGFRAPIISGKDGTVSTPFGTQGEVAVGTGAAAGATKMNTKKMRDAKVYLGEQFNDPMLKRWMVLTQEDNDALLDEVPATSEDFQKAFGAAVDEQGNLIRMLGFNFIHLELDNPMLNSVPDFYTDANGYRINPFWVQGGLVANYWKRLRSEVGKVPELEFNLGTYASTTLAATRTQPGRCGYVLNQKG